jgi:Xaa-Pro aminopeptidase
MITMNPVLLCGRSVWDKSFFPPDEFGERIRIIRSLMRGQEMDALLVFGNRSDYANLSYLTHFIPRSGWAITIIPLAGDPTLFFSAGGDRDIPFMKTITWIQEVRYLKNIGNGINAILKEKYAETRKLGIVGTHLMSSQLCDRLLEALSNIEVIEADHLMDCARTRLRPRECSAIIQAASIAGLAKQEMIEFFSKGEPVQKTVMQAELTARKLGAHDVRLLTLVGHGPWLSPLEGLSLAVPDRLIAYLAVEFQGYWADLAVTFPAPDSEIGEKAKHALRRMATAAKPGTTGGAIASYGMQELGSKWAGKAAEIGLGSGIGLSLEQPPIIKMDGKEDLVEGNILSFKVFVPDDKRGVFLSDLVMVGENGGHSIFPPSAL